MNWSLRLRALAVAASLALVSPSEVRAVDTAPEVQSLERIQAAAQKLDYTGVFVYQESGRMQSSRIAHKSMPDGAHEKLEILDGQPREVLREGDETRCLIPASRTVLVEQGSARDAFPALLQTTPRSLAEFYRAKRVGIERVAGLECEALVLEPRDRLRYGYRLCAETKTGLLLKAQTVNEHGDLVEQIAFSEVRIGVPIESSALKASWDTEGWRVEHASGSQERLPRWSVAEAVPGFKKVRELRRVIDGHADVGQFVFSDGLAAISVFIEPWRDGQPTQETSGMQGALNMLSRRRGEWLVTVLGEAPMVSIRKFADAVELKASPGSH